MTYRELKKEFDGRADQKGFHFSQIKRDGLICLYQKSKENGAKHYEVFKIKECPEYVIGGVLIEAHESVPRSSDWGFESFTYLSLEEAIIKFGEMVRKED